MYVLSIISRCPKCRIMLETYLLCSEMNVLAFISSSVVRANSRMTVARNRMSREKCRLSRIYSPSYTGASQTRPRSRRYKTRSRAFFSSLREWWKGAANFLNFIRRKKNNLGRVTGERKDERTRRGVEREGRNDMTRGRILCLGVCHVSTSKQLCSIGWNLLWLRYLLRFPTYLPQVEVETQIYARCVRDARAKHRQPRTKRNRKFQNWQSRTTFRSVSVCITAT